MIWYLQSFNCTLIINSVPDVTGIKGVGFLNFQILKVIIVSKKLIVCMTSHVIILKKIKNTVQYRAGHLIWPDQ